MLENGVPIDNAASRVKAVVGALPSGEGLEAAKAVLNSRHKATERGFNSHKRVTRVISRPRSLVISGVSFSDSYVGAGPLADPRSR